MAEESIVRKAYYSIGDVCEITGLEPHVLRYWETQFTALSPSKNKAGNRVYRPKEVELIHLVKHLLYDQKYTIQGANRKILDMRKEGELPKGRQEALTPELLSGMKDELERMKEIFTVPPEGEPS